MNRWIIAAAVLLLLFLIFWFGFPGEPRPDPERPSAESPPPPATPEPTLESPLPSSPPGDVGTTGTPAEPEPVPDLGIGIGREGQVPPELLGTGEALLHLWLVDAATEDPVAMPVTLWRLGVPEGDGWSGGDQIQKLLTVPVPGAILQNLPPGRYRVQCDEQRKGAADPDAFTISPGKNVRHVKVCLPRTFRALLRVFDVDGNEIREGALETGRSGENRETTPWAPKWAKPRRPIKGRGYGLSGGHSDSMVKIWDPRPNPLAGDLGFDLGAHEESTRLGSRSKLHRLRVEGCCEVRAGVSSSLARDVTLCGMAVPLTTLLEGVRWPDGVTDDRSTAKITALCFAEIHGGGDPLATAKKAGFYVRIRMPGYRVLSYRWRLGTPVVQREFAPSR